MKIIGVIPARYESSRFEGKPLADILTKPMIWWTYQQVKKVKGLDAVYVATDDKRIVKKCEELDIKVILTSNKHTMMLESIHEVSTKIEADLYVSIAVNEPLIEPEAIEKVINEFKKEHQEVISLRTRISNPVDVINSTTIKVVTDINSYALYASRNPIPHPKASLNYDYYKRIDVYGLTKTALELFVSHKKGPLESIEDFDLLRFLEYGMKVKIVDVTSKTISVDTLKDLKRITEYIEKQKKKAIRGVIRIESSWNNPSKIQK